MRMIAWDPDVETIVSRIKRNDIDLQPDFQRGEVWSEAKKKRLIDTILRNWHVPPIHIIEVNKTAKQVVLDGQQRLVAIRDFALNKLRIDGTIKPYDAAIESIDGRTYVELPEDWKRKFDQFTIRFFRITEYQPDEPAELFFRLNQPTYLTSAEQRNAFFGPARQQIKELVQTLEEHGINKDFTGFSNSRMAYDDIIARLCFSLEIATLTEKITSNGLADRYRSTEAFPDEVINDASLSIRLLGESRLHIQDKTRFNKATLYSWLWFISQANKVEYPELTESLVGRFINYFESLRNHVRNISMDETFVESIIPSVIANQLILIYNDRATARVADVSSVVYRDIITWIFYILYLHSNKIVIRSPISSISGLIDTFKELNSPIDNVENFLEKITIRYNWGRSL